jgi:hypothetical protein
MNSSSTEAVAAGISQTFHLHRTVVCHALVAPRTLRSSVHLQRLLDQDGGLPGDLGRGSQLRASLTSPVAAPPALRASLTHSLPHRPLQQPPQEPQLTENPSSSSVVQPQTAHSAAQRALGSMPGGTGPLSSSAAALPRGLCRSSAAPKATGLQVGGELSRGLGHGPPSNSSMPDDVMHVLL